MHYTQTQVYVIRWRPSKCSVDPIEEIMLDNDDTKHFIGKVLFIIRNMCQYHIIIVFTAFRVKWSSCQVHLFYTG